MAKGGKDSKPAPEGPGKADFSAYWALKIREWFDGRKRYDGETCLANFVIRDA